MARQDQPNIAVIGAGIGGTSTAILLRAAGYKCTVFEQSSEFLPVGAGINFGPNGTRIFHAMGLGEEIRKIGINPLFKSNRRWDTGEIFFTADNLALGEKYGSEFMAFHRADLQRMLSSAAGLDIFELGKRLTWLQPLDDSVRLGFEDGSEAEFDAVIGADGLHSKVREHLLGSEPSSYFGHVAYRAIVPVLNLKVGSRWRTIFVGGGQRNVMYLFTVCGRIVENTTSSHLGPRS